MKVTRGFTLLELLLAMAIFSMISLAGFTIFNAVLGSEEHSREKLTRLNQLQTTFLLMERDFTQLARRPLRGQEGESTGNFIYLGENQFSEQQSAITFARQGWTNPGLALPRSDMQQVSYRVKEKKLERLHFNFVDPAAGEEPKVRELIDNINELTFEFFYDKKWHQEMPDGKVPGGIAVILTADDIGEIRRQFLLPGDINNKPGA